MKCILSSIHAIFAKQKREYPYLIDTPVCTQGLPECAQSFFKSYMHLAKNNISQSMSRKGDPYDNAVSENFFSFLKC